MLKGRILIASMCDLNFAVWTAKMDGSSITSQAVSIFATLSFQILSDNATKLVHARQLDYFMFVISSLNFSEE